MLFGDTYEFEIDLDALDAAIVEHIPGRLESIKIDRIETSRASIVYQLHDALPGWPSEWGTIKARKLANGNAELFVSKPTRGILSNDDYQSMLEHHALTIDRLLSALREEITLQSAETSDTAAIVLRGADMQDEYNKNGIEFTINGAPADFAALLVGLIERLERIENGAGWYTVTEPDPVVSDAPFVVMRVGFDFDMASPREIIRARVQRLPARDKALLTIGYNDWSHAEPVLDDLYIEMARFGYLVDRGEARQQMRLVSDRSGLIAAPQPTETNAIPRLSYRDYVSLVHKAIDGDETATRDLQAYCRATGRDYNEEIKKWRWRLSPEFLKRVMQQHEDEMNDPVRQMIYARMSQPDIVNDPVLGALFQMPEQELLETVKARVTNPSDRYRPSQEDQEFLEMMKARLTGAITVSSTAQPTSIETNAGNWQQGRAWRGTGQPPKTKAEKIAAYAAWQSIDKLERLPLVEWLEINFGANPDGSLAVAESTFHGWRKLKKP